MSFAIAYSRGLIETLVMFPVALVVIAPAFVFHELGHKFAAQKYGYFAEYRMWARGLMFAVLLAVLTTYMGSKFLFIAPGAVYFSARGFHRHSNREIGKIGIAGPIINLILAAGFGLLGVLSGDSALGFLGFMGAYVNSFLAIFNLIPFPPFDGQKIFAWDKRIWVIILALAVILFVSVIGYIG